MPTAPASVRKRGLAGIDTGARGVHMRRGDGFCCTSDSRIETDAVSETEEANHRLTGHAQHRSWCSHCVRARGRADGHPRQRPEGHQWPELAFDYAYLSSRCEEDDAAAEADGQSPLLNMRDGQGRGIFPYLMQAKGVDHDLVNAELNLVRRLS